MINLSDHRQTFVSIKLIIRVSATHLFYNLQMKEEPGPRRGNI
jgi:hypothetical protein